MRRKIWTGAAAALVLSLAALRGFAADEGSPEARSTAKRACNERTIGGSYGVQVQGTRPAGTQTESVVGIVWRHYDGTGAFTQIANVKGSITGTVPDQRGSGVYQVNPNCTALAIFEPAPGVRIEERMVIVDGGRLVYSAPMVPAGAMLTGTQRRIR